MTRNRPDPRPHTSRLTFSASRRNPIDRVITSVTAGLQSQASRRPHVNLALILGLLALPVFSQRAHGQVTLTTAVDMALSHSPKLRIAQTDVDKARASLEQARDVYIPTVTVGIGAGGYAWGYSPNPPALFTFNSQSLVFSYSQRDFIRAGRFGLHASELILLDARQGVIEDAALGFLALRHDQQRQEVLRQENDLAQRLVAIIEDRVTAGRDTAIDLTTSRLTAAQIRLAALRAEDETADDRDHLALLMGMSSTPSLTADSSLPPVPEVITPAPALTVDASPAVSAAYATAASKEEIARGDHRYLLRPQLSFGAQYNRYDTFTNSFGTIESIHGSNIGANEGALGIELQIPLFDKGHKAKAEESAADAAHARAQADDAQRTALDGQFKLRHSIDVLKAQADVSRLEQELAQQQLDALLVQLNTAAASANGPALSPKDEQNSRIAERQKYLSLVDADYQLKEAQIQLLRQTGQLEEWLHQALSSTPSLVALPSAPPR